MKMWMKKMKMILQISSDHSFDFDDYGDDGVVVVVVDVEKWVCFFVTMKMSKMSTTQRQRQRLLL